MRRAVRRQPGKSSNTGEGAGSVRGVERAEGQRSVGGEIDSDARGEKHRAASAARAGTGNSESSARDMRKQGMHGRAAEARKEAEKAAEFCADVEREARRLRDASREITAKHRHMAGGIDGMIGTLATTIEARADKTAWRA
ncbi:hypothetical protein ERJ75_000817300 [Trypanosoma vivax]|nr:hypothetical protein ERJ75_000817300 [Trypanosoma vivax]